MEIYETNANNVHYLHKIVERKKKSQQIAFVSVERMESLKGGKVKTICTLDIAKGRKKSIISDMNVEQAKAEHDER